VRELPGRDCDKVVCLETVVGHDPCDGLLSEVALNLNIHFQKFPSKQTLSSAARLVRVRRSALF
jgi:hypothetical protein